MTNTDKSDEEKKLQFEKFSRIGKSNVRKSKSFERRVSDLLESATGYEFRRRRSEGRDNKTIAINRTADVMCTGGDIKFSIEAKSGTKAEKFCLNGLMNNPVGTHFTIWWHQASYDAELLTKYANNGLIYYPMLIFKYSLAAEWIAIPNTLVENSIIQFNNIPQHIVYDGYKHINPVSHNISKTKNKKNFKYYELNLQSVFMTSWKQFAASIKPETLFYVLPEKSHNQKDFSQEGQA